MNLKETRKTVQKKSIKPRVMFIKKNKIGKLLAWLTKKKREKTT
jgi:hypothetical protein